MTRRLIGAGLLVGIASTMVIVPNAAAQDESRITLTVGLLQDLVSPNVTVGYLVSAYEVWNLQYATLTDKAADDFATIPGLAESWEGSDDGLTYTYTLREGLKWSDGEPLTADDIAYTINRSRDEEWINHFADRAEPRRRRRSTTAPSRSSRRCPTRSCRRWTSTSSPSTSTSRSRPTTSPTYDALDGVALRAVLARRVALRARTGRWSKNPNWYGRDNGIDRIVFRVFTNPDAMVAALQQGEIDAAHDIPRRRRSSSSRPTTNIEVVAGQQGGFTELALNGMAGGIGDGHPALQDINVRHAISHAIDRDVMFERVDLGLGGGRHDDVAVAPTRAGCPNPRRRAAHLRPRRGQRRCSTRPATSTPTATASARCPTAAGRSSSATPSAPSRELGPAIREFITGLLSEIGIATEVDGDGRHPAVRRASSAASTTCSSWGWTPFVDPDPMLSYFTCDQVTTDPDDARVQRRQLVRRASTTSCTSSRRSSSTPTRGARSSHEMLRLFNRRVDVPRAARRTPTLQAYRTDRFEGWTAAAGRDRPGAVHQHVADLRQPDPVEAAMRRRAARARSPAS